VRGAEVGRGVEDVVEVVLADVEEAVVEAELTVGSRPSTKLPKGPVEPVVLAADDVPVDD